VKYLVLMVDAGEAPAEAPAPRAVDTAPPELVEWIEEMSARGVHLGGARLRPPSEARTVRVRGGERVVTEGPFAEAREQVAGFGVIEAEDLDEAIAVMSRHPVAALGPIEIRPFVADAELDAEVLRSL